MSPIRGMTDTVQAAFPVVGRLRKGGEAERDKDGRLLKIGPDLPFFRFTSDRPEVAAAFTEAYGKEPALIRVYLPYADVATSWACWKEKWSAGGLQHRCNGETEVLWLGKDGKYYHTSRPCGGGCDEVGRLALLIPELIAAGFVGYITFESHSVHDILSIQASLLAAAETRIGNPLGLRGIQWTLRRVKEKVSTPAGNGKRARRDKWLVKLEPAADWVQLQLQQAHNATMMLPAASGLPLSADAAERDVDLRTGEIIDSSAHEIDEEMPEPADEPDPTPAPATAPVAAGPVPTAATPPHNLGDNITLSAEGTALGDWTSEIGRAKTRSELTAVGARIRTATMLTAEMRTQLKPTYSERWAALKDETTTAQVEAQQ